MYLAVPVLLPAWRFNLGSLKINGRNIYIYISGVEKRVKNKSIKLEYSEKKIMLCWRNKYKYFKCLGWLGNFIEHWN